MDIDGTFGAMTWAVDISSALFRMRTPPVSAVTKVFENFMGRIVKAAMISIEEMDLDDLQDAVKQTTFNTGDGYDRPDVGGVFDSHCRRFQRGCRVAYGRQPQRRSLTPPSTSSTAPPSWSTPWPPTKVEALTVCAR
ncbi:MAG: hypothetical protein IPG34_19545 [Rhodocyclaceae bacterium]|nr:hypothetical protein [Rhodocyclaceae bacterium]